MMTKRIAVALLAAGLMMGGMAGCKSRQVERVDPRTVTDFGHRFDEDDARMTAEVMINDVMQRPWIDSWLASAGERPVVIVGTVRNDTSDYIDTKLFTKQIERELINGGRVRIVAARDERGEIRDERLQGRDWNRPETVKRMAYELGADFMLIGRVGENVEISRDRKRRVQYYQVNLELIDIESNEKVWNGEHQIEKLVRDRP